MELLNLIAIDSKADNSAMQKSKSSSNVGQFVSKKIFKTRSKSQTRTSWPTKAEWTPRGNCTWTSDNGRQVTLTNSNLQNLTEVEAKVLQRVAIEKINQLNIGVSVAAPSDTENSSKPQKRRPLAKKKAMTTSFFDIGRKEDKGSNISIFGNTLENCVAHDQKRRTNLTASSDRGSRNSITSLFRGSSSNKVRSCESLPSGTYNLPHSETNTSSITSGSATKSDRPNDNGNLVKAAAMQMSRSQSDIRRSSQEYESLQLNNSMTSPPPMVDGSEQIERQVPTFVEECIKYLEKYGLHSVGIFRVSTSKKRVRQMREQFDRTSNTSIDPETCPHDVATLLKEFLRDLPEPLLCRNLYKAFIKTQKIRNRRLQLEALSHLVQLLPTAHRDTLFVLLRFLAKVAACCDDIVIPDGSINVCGNKMDSNNLATVFAPNILRSSLPGEENNEQESMGDVINVIRTMIDHYEELFRVPAELMDEIYANMIDTFPEQLNYLCERRNVSDNDEIDSGGSNTPLNSPPPTGMMNNSSDVIRRTQQQISNEPPPPDGRTHNESLSLSKVPPVPKPRRIYTREDVMHGNTISKGDPPQDVSRRRSSKSKYCETDSSPQHRSSIKNKSSHNSDSSNTPRSSANAEFHSMQQPVVSTAISSAGAISSRRLSSPYVLDRTGVLTASLKIPVQMQAAGSSSSNSGGIRDNDDDEVFYKESAQFDLSKIPYIEDSAYPNELGNCIKGFPITGSLSFGGANASGGGDNSNVVRKNSSSSKVLSPASSGSQIYQIPIAYENQQISSSSLSSADKAGTGGESTSKLTSFLSSISMAAASPSAAKSKSKEKKAALLSTNMQQKLTSTKTVHLQTSTTTTSDNKGKMEQRQPTSISNIGGAILRSKTADFERMSSPQSTSSVMTARKTRNFTPESSNDAPSQRGTLYKRQELISSAKRK